MGYYNSALIEVTFPNHVTFSTYDELERFIEDKKEMMDYCKQKLHALVLMTEPKKFINEEHDPLIWLNNEFDTLMEELEDAIYWLAFANKLKGAWDRMHNKNGEVIYNPLVHSQMKESQYLQGDYITHDIEYEDMELDDKEYEKVREYAKEIIIEKNKKEDSALDSNLQS